MQIIIIGGGHVGRTLAATFEDDDDAIVFLDDDLRIVERAKSGSVDAVETLVTDIEQLQRGDEREVVVVAAMAEDGANLLIAQLLKVRFDVDHIIVRINDPRNRSSFEDLDIETVCTTSVLADALCQAVSPHRITA